MPDHLCLLVLLVLHQAEIEKVQKRREEKEAEKQRMEEELVRLSQCVWGQGVVGMLKTGVNVRKGQEQGQEGCPSHGAGVRPNRACEHQGTEKP
jgi:hypothetical protein